MGRHSYDKPADRRNWLTVSELADFLGQHPNTVKRWVDRGDYPDAAGRTPNGWRIWSPDQVTEILRIRTRQV